MTADCSALAQREIRRRHYLDLMGVSIHVSRKPLLGAARSRRLIPVVDDVTATPAEPASQRQRPLRRISESLSTLQPVKTERAAITVPARHQPDITPATFSVMLAISGQCLWLEEIPHRAVNRHYTQLLTAMALAVGFNQPQWHQFDWPIHHNTQFDLGDDAAQQSLHAYLQRQLAQSPCHSLVVLGEKTASRLGESDLPVERILQTQSAWDMLSDSRLKALAWRDLQSLRQ